MTTTAKAIYQDLLDRLSRAMMQRDMTAWVNAMALPHQMTTCDGKLVLETKRDIEISFADYMSAFMRLGIARMDRICEIARVSEPGRIEGYHTTAMFDRDGAPFPVYTVKWVLIEHEDECWRVAKSDSALSADTWSDIPHHDLSLFQREDTSDEQRLRKTVQAFLDRIDTTMLYGNFEEWKRAYKLPFVVETKKEQSIIDSVEKLRQEFALYNEAFRINRVSDVTRVVRTAEVIDDDLIIATYRAHIMSGASYVVEPWNGALTMRREGGQWYITKILRALGHSNWRVSPTEHMNDMQALTASNTNETPKTRRQ